VSLRSTKAQGHNIHRDVLYTKFDRRNEFFTVKAECLRLLATLRLDPARTRLISGFVDTYLRLNGQEMQVFDEEICLGDRPQNIRADAFCFSNRPISSADLVLELSSVVDGSQAQWRKLR
jgi:hypothetical protein